MRAKKKCWSRRTTWQQIYVQEIVVVHGAVHTCDNSCGPKQFVSLCSSYITTHHVFTLELVFHKTKSPQFPAEFESCQNWILARERYQGGTGQGSEWGKWKTTDSHIEPNVINSSSVKAAVYCSSVIRINLWKNGRIHLL